MVGGEITGKERGVKREGGGSQFAITEFNLTIAVVLYTCVV